MRFLRFGLLALAMIVSGALFTNFSYYNGTSLLKFVTRNPHIQKFGGGGRALSPDGRLSITPDNDESNPAAASQFLISLVNPGKMTSSPDGYPNLASLTTKPVYIELPTPRSYPLRGGHMSLSFNPRSSHSDSYRCDDQGEARFHGVFECFDLVLFVSDSDMKLWRADVSVRTNAYLTSALDSPRNANATIQSAKITRDFTRQMFLRPDKTYEQVPTFETSTTADGRLHFGKGTTSDGVRAGASYNFSPTFDDNGWTKPLPYHKAYTINASFQGMTFQDRYPFARQQLRDAAGDLCTDTHQCFGDYLWISQDGADVFFTATAAYSESDHKYFNRSSYSVVGLRTNYKVVTIDNALNRCRMNVLGMSTSPGLLSSAWSKWSEIPAGVNYPMTPETNVYPIKAAGNFQFSEVPMSRYFDRSYLLYLPMNELTTKNPSVPDRHKLVGEENTNGNVTGIDHDHTPDLSGAFLTSQLTGNASFPTEFKRLNHGVYTPGQYECEPSTPLGDNDGFKGKGIYFPDLTSSVVVPSSHATATPSLNSALSDFTIEFAVKISEDAVQAVTQSPNQLPILSKGASYWYSFGGASGLALNIHFGLLSASNVKTVAYAHIPLDAIRKENKLDGWLHVVSRGHRFATTDQMTIQTYVNGAPVAKTTGTGRIVGDVSDMILGARNAQMTLPASTTYVYILDEVAVSKVPRNNEYIANASATPYDLTSKFVKPVLGRMPAGFTLNQSQWVKNDDFRIPARIGRFFDPTGPDFAQYGKLVTLGEKIFEDKDLAFAQSGQHISCSSCHSEALSLSDGRKVAVGVHGPLTLNAPTAMNRAFSIRQFFDARDNSVMDLALDPLINPNEMGGTVEGAVTYASTKYAADFAAIYGRKPVNAEKLSEALTAYLMTKITPDSVYDKVVQGTTTLPMDQQNTINQGFAVFTGKGMCINCHNGSNFSDEMKHAVGTDAVATAAFKTPTLRGLMKTAPYFHDGSAADLDAVIDHYVSGGRQHGALPNDLDPMLQPIALTPYERSNLKAFLQALGTDAP